MELALRLLDPLVAILTLLPAVWMKLVRRAIRVLPTTRRALETVGVFPIRRHFYEPLFAISDLKKSLREPRSLPGVALRADAQRALLLELNYQAELKGVPWEPGERALFHYHNSTFKTGDADAWYSVIRHFRPRRIIEIGSGWSTGMARLALLANHKADASYSCDHTCIEPFPPPSLGNLPVRLIREKVENVPLSVFDELTANDILFIDSSHMIRPQGDVLFEYLEILPRLRQGVIIHIHDVFTPRDYLDEWIKSDMWFWNEQYLLEAVLSHTTRYEVMLALNFLANDFPDDLARAFPSWGQERVQPGSFYIRVA